MKRLLTTVTVTALSAMLALSSFEPAAAGPIQPMAQPATTQTGGQAPGVIDVQYRHHRGHYRPHFRPHYRHHYRGGYWHGHRGYRYARPGYRRYHDGFWYPLAAFTAGAIIGGAVSHPPRGSAHVRWCASRYKTYRASDNTYQPTNGPRRQCVSP
ncbi:BA14K family protein [Rhizobium sp. P38BS-XIX]|uniref:BA14K family protein n=1 Tax=Rhizobium sp. P38BS-XIX TaxID=2726740 RepID=UPI0032B2F4A1